MTCTHTSLVTACLPVCLLQSVNIYRLVTRNSVEEKILERAKKKMVLDHLVIQRMDTSSGRSDSSAAGSKAGGMFSRAELAKIVQFGAEDLFSQVDDEAKSRSLVDMDIDEILSRADADAPAQQAAADEASRHDATEAFLGAFKVANFSSTGGGADLDEEDDADDAAPEEEEEVDWSRIVPAHLIPAEQLSADGNAVPLYLPPRARNQVKSYAENQLVAQNEARGAKDDADADAEANSGGDDDEEDATGGRRVRRNPTELDSRDAKHAYKSLMMTGSVESAVDDAMRNQWRKRGVDRDVAVQFTTNLVAAMQKAIDDAKVKAEEEAAAAAQEGEKEKERDADEEEEDVDEHGRKKKRVQPGCTGEYLGITLSATDLFSRMHEFATLHSVIPTKALQYRIHTRKSIPAVRWSSKPPGMMWKSQHDSMLLVGVHFYGLNQMDALIEDERFGLQPMVAIKEATMEEDAEMTSVEAVPEETQPPPPSEAGPDTAVHMEITPTTAAGDAGTAAFDAPLVVLTVDAAASAAVPVASPSSDAAIQPTADVDAHMADAADTNNNSEVAAPSTTHDVTSTPSALPSNPAAEDVPAPPAAAAAATASPPRAPSFRWVRLVKNAYLSARALTLLRALSAEAKLQEEEKEHEAAKAQKAADKKASKKAANKKNSSASGDAADARHATEDATTSKSASKEKKSKEKNNHRIDDMFKKTARRSSRSRSRSPSPHDHDDARSKSKKDKKRHRSSSPSAGDSHAHDAKKAKKEKKREKESKVKSEKKSKSASDSSKKKSAGAAAAAVSDAAMEIDEEVLTQCKPLMRHLVPKLRELRHLATVAEGGFAAHKSETRSLITHVGEEITRIARTEVPGGGIARNYLRAHLWEVAGKYTEPKHAATKLQALFKAFTNVAPAVTTQPTRTTSDTRTTTATTSANSASRT